MRVLLVTTCLTLIACIPASGDRVLKVCAAPDELPFSDRQGRGFENQIAQLLADQLGVRLQYSWQPGQDCDLVLRAPPGSADFLPTRPYYRSSYVFLTRSDRQLYFRSIDDPRLLGLRFGVQVASDGSLSRALERRGVTRDRSLSSSSLIAAVREKELDVGLVWGPSAGAFAHGESAPLRIAIIDAGEGDSAFAADVCLGVRKDRAALKDSLEKALVDRREAIDTILRQYGVPLCSHE